MIGHTSAPDLEWFHLFDCSDCHRRTLLQGVRTRRSLNLLVVRLRLGRRWFLRCQTCGVTRNVNEKTWRQWREQGVTPQEAYLERQKIRVLAQKRDGIAVSR